MKTLPFAIVHPVSCAVADVTFRFSLLQFLVSVIPL